MADDNTGIEGKKIFFFYPSTFTQNEIVSELAQQEYEVYVIKEEARLMKALHHYPASIVFASVEETLQAKDWEIIIRRIMSGETTKNALIGILVNSASDDIKRLYLASLKVPCGCVVVKPDIAKAIKLLQEILRAADAKGRRKFIRADTRDDPMATVNLSIEGKYVNGAIRDISVVGFSCIFENDPGLEKNSLFSDIQIKLQSSILKVEGIIFGSRVENGSKIYVVVFTQKTDPAARTKIRTYIQRNLQLKMDQETR
jgi:hypothetical protein